MLITAKKFHSHEQPPRLEAATFVSLGALMEMEIAVHGASGGWTLEQYATRDPRNFFQAAFSDFDEGADAEGVVGYTGDASDPRTGVVDSRQVGMLEAELGLAPAAIDPDTTLVEYGLYQLPEDFAPDTVLATPEPHALFDRLRDMSSLVVDFYLSPGRD
jgi:hypothetical protein